MKIGQTAKQIDSMYQYNTKNKPSYIGETIGWKDSGGRIKVDGRFIARKYLEIIEMIETSKAKVKIEGNRLKIIYNTGTATIAIDELVKKILIPELKPYIVTMD